MLAIAISISLIAFLDYLIVGDLYKSGLEAYGVDFLGLLIVLDFLTVTIFFVTSAATNDLKRNLPKTHAGLRPVFQPIQYKTYSVLVIVGLSLLLNPITLSVEKMTNKEIRKIVETASKVSSTLEHNRVLNVKDQRIYNIDHIELKNNKIIVIDEKGHSYSLKDTKLFKGERKLKDSEKKILEKFENFEKDIEKAVDLNKLRTIVALTILYQFILLSVPAFIAKYSIYKLNQQREQRENNHKAAANKLDAALNTNKEKVQEIENKISREFKRRIFL